MDCDMIKGELDNVIILIDEVIKLVYDNDMYLIFQQMEHKNENHNSEMSIVARMMFYFGWLLNINHKVLGIYDIDSEYNRDILDVKKNRYGKKFRPDIIIHKRGSNKDNFMMIEIKMWWRKNEIKKDVSKVRENIQKFQYLHGLVILLGKEVYDTKYYFVGKEGYFVRTYGECLHLNEWKFNDGKGVYNEIL